MSKFDILSLLVFSSLKTYKIKQGNPCWFSNQQGFDFLYHRKLLELTLPFCVVKIQENFNRQATFGGRTDCKQSVVR